MGCYPNRIINLYQGSIHPLLIIYGDGCWCLFWNARWEAFLISRGYGMGDPLAPRSEGSGRTAEGGGLPAVIVAGSRACPACKRGP
jgi:hypothetical protein